MAASRAPRNVGRTPPQRGTARPPARRPVGRVPKGDPPVPRATAAPYERGIAAPPHPRTPKLVRDVDGAGLGDLFVIFRDLRRPPRPAPRLVRKRSTTSGGRS